MVIEVNPLQYSKAYIYIEVTVLGIIVFMHPHIRVLLADSIIALQPFLLSYTLLPFATVISVRLLQSANARSPMAVTE